MPLIQDDAIDLLYPSAKDELRDLMEGDEPPPEQAARSLHARFYRFLDSTGAVIKPPNASDVGELDGKDRSSTFPQQVAGHTANRLCPGSGGNYP